MKNDARRAPFFILHFSFCIIPSVFHFDFRILHPVSSRFLAMPNPRDFGFPRTWPRKFRDAFRGMVLGVRGQRSFGVHFAVAVAVIGCGWGFRVGLLEWFVLLLCITVVLTAEMFNSAMESMAKAVSLEHQPYLGDALDIGSAAVLAASLGAALVGALLFTHRLGVVFGWWHDLIATRG
jgi:diacylglycerol kinase